MKDRWTDTGRTDRRTHGKNNDALAHPYHQRKSCSKFGLIPPCGIRADIETDGGVQNIPIAFKKHWKNEYNILSSLVSAG